MQKERILAIDDDQDMLDNLTLTLSQRYSVIVAHNGREGLEMVRSKNPALVITDYGMPEMNGLEFCRHLRNDILLRHLPVIMLTAQGETKDILSGIESGADDYLIKPFEPQTLIARTDMILKRNARALDASPLTHLPGNNSINEELQKRIDNKEIFAVGYIDLNKFKNYNDKYGFEKGDDMIRATARVLIDVFTEAGGNGSFIGHIGGDDFIFICDDESADAQSQKIISKFDHIVPDFYNEEDRRKGYILGKDRQGNPIKAGLASLSIGIVSNAYRSITHIVQVGEIGADLKKLAKAKEKSFYIRDQRNS